MPIPLKPEEIVTIQATSAVVADKLWIRQIIINTPGPTQEGSVMLEYGPWTGGLTAGSVIWRDDAGNDTVRRIQINDLYAAKTQCPELQNVYDAIVNGIPAISVFVDSRAVI